MSAWVGGELHQGHREAMLEMRRGRYSIMPLFPQVVGATDAAARRDALAHASTEADGREAGDQGGTDR